MMKKMVFAISVLAVLLNSTGCKQDAKSVYSYNMDFKEISKWTAMVTPGGGEGSVTKADNVAIIKAAPDGWGGVQSEKITLDLTKDPILLVQVKESRDGFKWGVKFVPSTLQIEDHAWGFYLIEDNNFKWNNYAGVDLRAKLGQDVIGLYGEKIEGVFWIYTTGGPESTVEITGLKIFNQK